MIEYTTTSGVNWREGQLPIEIREDGGLIVRPSFMIKGKPYLFGWQNERMLALKTDEGKVEFYTFDPTMKTII